MKDINLEEKPLILFWEVTRACALSCRHCRAEARKQPYPGELSPRDALQLIGNIARLDPSILVLTGGDPLLRKDLPDIISKAFDRGLRVALSPAATPLLTQVDFGELRRRGVSSLSLSLDGACAETHDRFRGVPHTFERTLEAAQAAKDAGIMLQMNTTLSRTTLPELDAFAGLMCNIQPDVWSIFLLVPTGRARAQDLPTAEQAEQTWQSLLRLRRQVPFTIKTTEGHHFRRALLQAAQADLSLPPPHIVPTRDGKGVLFIAHNGDVQPSGFLPVRLGNALHDDLVTLYRQHPLLTRLRDDDALGGKCGQCEYRRVCGGSRSRAYGIYGDMFAADPLCNYVPKALRPETAPLPNTP